MAHTDCLQDTIKHILEAVPVLNFDPASIEKIHYRVRPAGIAGVFTQLDPKGGQWLPIAPHSCTLAVEELLHLSLELELEYMQEILSKLRPHRGLQRDLEIEASK